MDTDQVIQESIQLALLPDESLHSQVSQKTLTVCFVFDDVHEYLSQQNIKNVLTLWASSREAYNYQQARSIGVDIITMTPDLIKKVKGFGKDLKQFSLETCQMFRNDALSSGFLL